MKKLDDLARIFGLSEAVLLAAVTGLGYLAAFFYNYGLMKFYGISLHFINVDTTQFICGLTSIASSLFLLCLLFLRDDLTAWVETPGVLIYITLISVGITSVLFFFSLDNFYFSRATASILFVLSLTFVLVPFRFFSLTRNSGRIRRNPFGLAFRAWRLAQSKRVRFRKVSPLSRLVILGTALLNSSIFIPISLGYTVAARTSIYPVIQNGPYKGFVVVWQVGDDIFLLQSFNAKRRILTYDQVQVKVDKDFVLNLHQVHTGPLEDVYDDDYFVRNSPFTM